MVADSRIVERRLQNNLSFLVDDPTLFSNTAYRIMQNDKNKILITCVQTKINGKSQIIYFTEDYIPLDNILEQLSDEKLINLVIDIFKRIKSLNEYGFLNMDNILSDFNKIYVDVQTLEVLFIYLPLNNSIMKTRVSVETRIKTNFIKYLQSTGNAYGKDEKITRLLNILTDGTINVEEMLREAGVLTGKISEKKPEVTHPEEISEKPVRFYLINRASGRLINIGDRELIIGRNAPTEEGRVVDPKKQVGRQHCKIIYHDNKYYLKDLKSVNGTYLNNKRIPAMTEMLLSNADVIRVAHIELIVRKMEDNL